MAPRVFNQDYIEEWLDELWVLRENLSMDLDWSYECHLNRFIKRVKQQLIDPHKAERKRRQYEFAYTTCVQNLEGLRDTARYLCEQSLINHPSTHAHYQDILNSLQQQEEGLLQIQDIFCTNL